MHVAVFAFPFGCHALALINLVQKLARAAQETQFSFLNTEKSNNSIFLASITNLPDNIKTYNVADGVPQSHVFSGDPIERVELFIKETPENFKMALDTAVAETGQEISCLIADAFLSFSGSIAECLSIPWIPVWIPVPHSLSTHIYTDMIRQHYANSLSYGCSNSCGDGNDEELEEKTLEIPGLSELHIADLPVEVLPRDAQDTPFSCLLGQIGNMVLKADTLVVNFYQELYPIPLLNDLKSKFSNLLNVGFISLSMPPPSLPPSNEDTTGCLSWLDSQKSKTVAYISFGTVVNIPRSEIEELAAALEESRIPFLWSLRENIKDSDVWRIGERIDGGAFTKTGVARSLDLILQHEQGRRIRSRVQALKELVLKASAPGGHATQAFRTLVEKMTPFSMKCLDILAWPVFGLGYPIYASILAIETNSNSDTQKLITYWVSISVVLLFEHSLAFWPYIKLMIVGYLVLPYFHGSLYVYKHLVHPCLSMGPRIITCKFNKLEELLFKKDDFLVELKRYMKENGSDALEDLIASTKKSAKPNVAVNEISTVAAKDSPKFEHPILTVQYKDSNAFEITEKGEVASTKQLKAEQPKHPVRFEDSNSVEVPEKKEVKEAASTAQLMFEQPELPVLLNDSNAAEITEKREVTSTEQLKSEQPKHPVQFEDSNSVEVPEKKEVASTAQLMFEQPELPVLLNDSNAAEKSEKREVTSTKQVRQIESNTRQTENRTRPPLEFINTGTTTGGRDLGEMLPPENVLKEWTCAICQVTTQSEAVLNSHLQGSRHKAACERLKAKNQTPKSEPLPDTTASTGIDVTLKSHIDVSSHLQGKRHKKACERLNSKNQASSSNVSPASVGKNANFPESKPEKFTINNSDPPENRIPEAKKQENLMESRFVEVRDSKWWCTLCNISCTCKENMQIHLNAKKHLARMRALDGPGSGVHA
ncbi:hypothetical protein SADUNF_Sadunf09G0062900 [Salix dunnii]|uniref:C2H2-type domain-containing protein n=1 Tax=Salix dunnii TaxID=1413687 RepID=A0A835MR06_9ROSI|nr:hypothetical protein SADUNF_Sadunf09G0062900 [Salix dunnii]